MRTGSVKVIVMGQLALSLMFLLGALFSTGSAQAGVNPKGEPAAGATGTGSPTVTTIISMTASSTVSATTAPTTSPTTTSIISPTVSLTASPTPPGGQYCDDAWRLVSANNVGNGRGIINDVAVIASDNIWAVGFYSSGSYISTHDLIMHWDGTSWAASPSPNLSPESQLLSISANSANDIWASGFQGFNPFRNMLHWDGVSWAQVPTPSSGLPNYVLLEQNPINSVIAFSATDAWAAGTAIGETDQGQSGDRGLYVITYQYLIHWDGTAWTNTGCACYEVLDAISARAPDSMWILSNSTAGAYEVSHWNGAGWTATSIPNFGFNALFLSGINGIAANDVWITGSAQHTGDTGYTPLALHWNGHIWQNIALPPLGNGSARLFSIKGTTSNDLWAVGEAGCSDYNTCIQIGPVALHWNGSQWTEVTAPASFGSLHAVGIQSPGNAWVGGTHGDPSIGHWNGSAWTETPTTLVGENSNFLNAVTVVTANDIWAVGGYLRYNYIEQRQFHTGEVIRTLIQHWDGSSWSVVPSPNDHPSSGNQDNFLNAVSATSANDIWAVGFVGSHSISTEHQYQFTPLESLIEHWDGTQWTVVGGLPDTSNLQLFDVEALAPDDIWAVGGTGGQNPGQSALILHWNGVQWSRVANPVSDASQLNSLDAVSADEIWAAGSRSGSPYVIHWDGANWTVANNTIEEGLSLLSIVAISSTNVWAVGTSYGTSIYMVHYDGSTWYGTFLPGPGPGPSTLNSIVANSDTDIWAAGSYVDADGRQQTLIMHYDGTQWSQVPSPNEGVGDTGLKGLAPDGPQNIWAVGNYQTSLAERVLVEHYPTLFADVPVGSTFYPYVQCLACRGIINGYSDGTFHTNNSVTRGQLSKIVSNAAGFSEPAGAQQFQDVLPGSTFYDFIWRLVDRGIMNGYPCGNPGYPCDPQNMPYFRPSDTATRGQISKIVSNAAGFNDPPGTQLYEDVSPNSTFYDYIQRLTLHAVMSGYPCGGTGEPCGPGNLPYFRPAANATRGQTSKIVSNTFFPQCNIARK